MPQEALWRHTQDPSLHQRWDLRFSEIDYLPRIDPALPQRFRYTTRLGFGIAVTGEGETTGSKDLPDGSHTSALRFGSSQSRSLILEGRGYWKYVPTDDGIRFITSYDYTTRSGGLGAAVDRLVFRPLMGWATAWSFDRLRLWLESGIDPAQAARQAMVHGIARVSLAAIFAFHGLVPKLLGPHPDEVRLLRDAGLDMSLVGSTIAVFGVLELGLAAGLLVTWHRAWLPAAVLAFALIATVVVAVTSPGYLGAAFNPVSLNLALAALAVIDLLTIEGIPSAGRCERRPVGDAA